MVRAHARRRDSGGETAVPIVMYHRLFADAAELVGWAKGVTRHWLPVHEFERQIRALAEQGYRAIPLATLLPGSRPIEVRRPIVITFDDGWASDYHRARPLLDELGWPSEHFVTVDWIGTDGFVSWGDLEEIARRGSGVHSHCLTHRDLDRLPVSEMRHELEASKARLEDRLGRRVEFLALPGGTGAGRSVRKAARELGYRGICTSKVGLNARGADPYALRRIPVTRHTARANLLAWVGGRALDRLALTQETLRLTRALVPRPLYGYLRDLVLR